MTFFSSQSLRARLSAGIVSPYDAARIKHGAYELSLGPEAFIGSTTSKIKQTLDVGQQIRIPPGQFALLLAEESLEIPAGILGFISIRAGIKFRGLVNVSGFHVDPGFTGRLKFAVYNAGSEAVVLARGERVFALWLGAFDQDVDDPYHGEHFKQDGITSQDVMRLQGHVASPAALSQEITELRSKISRTRSELRLSQALAIALIAAAFGLSWTLAANRAHEPPPACCK